MLKAWFNPSHIAAGFIAVLVGYTSSAVIIFQAAEAAGASPQEISSWLWALGIGMAVTSIGLSLRFRAPVLIAWSTPGGALLATGLPGFSLNEAIGVFLFNAALITLCGLLGWFDRIMRLVPASLAGAMLAGVLLPFGLNLFGALQEQTLLVGLMLACYLAGKLVFPRYVIPVTLLVGVVVAALAGQLHLEQLNWSMDDVDLWEVNEAFAVVPLAFMHEMDLSHDIVNVNGGACALGHPIGASGARIMVTLLNALEKRGLKRGIAAICIGGGEGTAIAIERP